MLGLKVVVVVVKPPGGSVEEGGRMSVEDVIGEKKLRACFYDSNRNSCEVHHDICIQFPSSAITHFVHGEVWVRSAVHFYCDRGSPSPSHIKQSLPSLEFHSPSHAPPEG
jgi:hypothetical protein